jgi:NDP-sugar pyrophosphorylase family protein
MVRQAIILAGGLGTRLGDITKNTPKPMLLVNGKPFLEYLILNLKYYGIYKIVLSTGYLAEKIFNHFGDGSSFGVEITYSEEENLLGTGGAVKLAEPLLDDKFLVLNGDSFFDINYQIISRLLNTNDALVVMSLRRVNDISRYGKVVLDGNKIKEFSEKNSKKIPGIVNGGVYAMNRNILNFIPEDKSSLEVDIFPKLVNSRMLVGYEFDGYFIDIGLPDDLNKAQYELLDKCHVSLRS